ncbi:MAG: S41 family peptidase, partial [Bacteroidota bacterium]
TLLLDQSFKVQGKITYFDVSGDGKKIAFVSRGKLFVSDIKGKFIKQIEIEKTERVIEVKWMSDNVTLLYSRTDKGWANWFTTKADKKSTEKQITFDEHSNRNISLNSDRTKAVYLSGRNFVKIIDLKSMQSETIVEEELWGFYNPLPYFSPNDEYILFTAYRNFEQDIFIYNIKTKTTINLTNTGVTETNPFWSPDGKYIYFTSDRYNASYPKGTQNNKLYRIPLNKFEKEFKSEKYNELFSEKEEKKDGTKDKKKGKKEKEDSKIKKEKIIITIDLDNIINRWESMSVRGGEQFSPYVINKDDKSNVLFISNRDKGENELWKTVIKPFEKNKTEKITGVKANSFSISEAKDKIYLLTKGNIYKLDLSSNKLDKIKIEHSFIKNLDNEFSQLFYETWTTLQENFYDKEFHGIDWNKMKERYEVYLPYLRNRSNLRLVLNEMLGELNASHLGFSSNGNEEKVFHKMKTMSTGIIFDQNEPYRVNYIISNSKADNKENKIQKGDVLTAVNGIKVNSKQNREYYFLSPVKNDELKLTFNRDGKVFDKRIHTENSGRVNTLLYDEWIQDNQDYVDNKSNKRIAYVYMKNMTGPSLNKFLIEMSSEGLNRDALILDLRYNRGGNVHHEVLNYLSQKPYFHWKYREGKKTTHPNVTPSAKPIVLLINEHSLSDAEVTANGFKELKLGKIIGTETYRWIIFTSGKSLVDGSFCRIPAWGCYTLDGKDLEKEGVKPDIYIDTNFKNRLENDDPQLDRAIEEILKELK